MGILTSIFEGRSLENPSTPLSAPDEWLYEAFGAQPTDAGITVTAKSALRSAAFACTHVLAQSVAQIPWDVFERDGENRVAAKSRVENFLLHNEPNPEMTSFSFRYAGVAQMCLGSGNFYVEIERDGAGRVKYLWPIIDATVVPLRQNKRLVGYLVRESDGAERRIDISNMIHVPCIPLDGTSGDSILTQARNKIALEQAAERFGSRLFGAGTRLSGVLESTANLNVEQRRKLEEQWAAIHSGSGNSLKTPVLPQGLTWKQISINPDDAQFLETRNFQVADIARMFRVPGVLIGVTDKTATYASVEQFLLSFAKFTLTPWLIAFEQEFNRKLFPNSTSLYSKLDLRGLERGDLQARAAFYKSMFEVGAYSPNRILALEDENSFEGGDMHLQPLNMAEFGKAPEGKPQPEPPVDQTDAERMFLPLFEDAVASIAKKSKRDAAWVKARFRPLVATLAIHAGTQNEDEQYLDELCSRSATWEGEAVAQDELMRMLAFVRGGKPCTN